MKIESNLVKVPSNLEGTGAGRRVSEFLAAKVRVGANQEGFSRVAPNPIPLPSEARSPQLDTSSWQQMLSKQALAQKQIQCSQVISQVIKARVEGATQPLRTIKS